MIRINMNIIISYSIPYSFASRCCSNCCWRRLLLKPGPASWIWILNNLDPKKPGPWITWTLNKLNPEKPEPWKTWTLKNMDSEKHEINMGLKNMSEFCLKKIMRNVISCLKFHWYRTKFVWLKIVPIKTQL